MKTLRPYTFDPFQSRNNNGSHLMRKARLGRVFLPALAIAVLCLISANTAQASQSFVANLTGAQEVPPSGSAGTGYGSVILSDDQTTITVNLGFTGLGSNAIDAHIHNAAPGVDGPVIFPLSGTPVATSGTFLQQTFSITPAQVTDLQGGLLYFNIHSSGFGGGEIRGQILLATCDTAGPVEVEATAGTFGPTAYATLKLAFDAINAGTHQGAINVEVCGNTAETFSAVLNASGSGGALYTGVGIQPLGGAGRTISGAMAAGSPLVDFNGADNVTVDGLNTGGNSLTISNTTVAGTAGTSTIRFINDASNNILQRVTISGSGNALTAGTVLFSTTTGANGNDTNLINLCNIGPAGTNLPLIGVLSIGTTTTAAQNNSNNQITNNNIFDFFNAAVDGPRGVLVSAGSTDWTISGNSFYQTATRTYTATTVTRVISIENTSGNNFTISGNFIGGSAPSAGGAAWTQAGAVSHTFIGIRISAGTTTATSVQGNTIQNISITNSATTSVGAGISAPSGSVNIGTVTGNTIGSQSITGSITQTNASAGFFSGILSQIGTLGTLTISNNTVGGVTMAGAGAQSFRGIRVETGTVTSITISNNTIGSTTTANSIQTNSSSTAAAFGISTSNATVASSITGNTVANFQLTSTGESGFRGVETTGAINGHIMSNNTIRDVSSASTSTSSTIAPVAAGIFANGTSNGRTISGNTIFNLSSTTAGATSVNVLGIFIGLSASSGTMNGNLIYNLSTASTSTTSAIRGIYLFNFAGTAPWNLTNNMIRLGTGVSATLNPIIRGINEDTFPDSTNNIWFNSIFIGGTQGGATVNTACVHRAVGGTMDIRNNILWNNRASTGAPGAGTGRHYSINAVSGGTLTTNFNNLFADANGGTVGFLTSDRITLTDWRAAGPGFDVNSFSANPSFVDPTNATTPDLHLTASNPESRGGQTIASVTTDFDAQTRPQPAATNPDIGADEGNFTVSPDLLAPLITYTPLGNSAGLVSRPLPGFATIVDNSGTVSGGADNPRLYYKKSTDANAFVGNTSADNGWKFVVASNGASPYDFTIDYTIIFGGTVSVDTIQYFVVAQDAVPNVAINSGTFAATPTSVQLTGAAFPIGGTINSYTISAALSGTKTVCASGCDYTGLTPAGGLFAAINSGVVTSNLVINIEGDLLVEDGVNSLNQWSEEGAGNYTMLIKPSGAPRSIVGTNTGALIKLNGADRVRIDGSTAGLFANNIVGGNPAIRELTIQNTNTGTSAAVISVQTGTNGAQSNTIQNVNVLGQDLTTTLVGISLGGNTPGTVGTDNDNNRVENCSIRRAVVGIYSAGASTANQNTGTVITQNDISATGAERVRRIGIVVFNENGIQITENSIGGIVNSEFFDAIGIGVGTFSIDATNTAEGGVSAALVSRNKVNGVSNDATFSAAGIAVAGSGSNTIQNNMISGVISDGTAPDIVAGIYVVGAIGSVTRLYHNSIAMTGDRGLEPAQMPSYGVAITGADPTVELKNNIFYTTQTASGGGVNAKSYAIGMVTTTFVNLDSNRNDFFSSGANAGFFRSGSLGAAAGTDYGTLALWQAAVADDANSQEIDPVYVNPLNNLHLNGATTPLLGDGITGFATVDFDNDPRPAANPDIGADELVQAVGGVIQAGTYYNASANDGDSLGGDVTITNTLYLNGKLSTGVNTLTLDCNASILGAGASSFVIGNLKKNLCGIGVKGFEVGTANGYSPVSVNVTAGTFPTDFTVKAVEGPQPNFPSPQYALQRYWSLSTPGSVTANLTFNYLDPPDVPGTANENAFVIFKYDGSFTMPGGTVSPATNQASITGVTSFSDWTLAQPNAPTAAPATISGQVTTTSGAPLAGVTMYLSGARSARAVTDSNGNYRFTNVDTANFYTVTPAILNHHFSPASRSFSLLANVTDATFTGTLDSVITGNVIDTPEYFVRQHYLDFLGREPDDAGLMFWSDQMRGCGDDFNCLERRTINVSAAYFLSIEFQETGGLVDGLYRASYGRAPLYAEFMPDTATVADGVIVGDPDWQSTLAANKQEFLDAWVQRAAFRAAYDNLANDGYVDTLISHTGVSFTDGERNALLEGLTSGTLSRAGVLQRVAQNESFVTAKFNEAFVRMQYFGYLRRNPDDSGFHFWLNKLNEFDGNFEQAEMVKAFLVSGEYRDRFRP